MSARLRRKRGGVFEHRRRRQTGTVDPHFFEQVDVGAQRDSARRERFIEPARRSQSEHRTVDTDLVAQVQMLGQPIHVRSARRRDNFHHRDAGSGQFRFGLAPVAAVDPQARELIRHDQRADRTREA